MRRRSCLLFSTLISWSLTGVFCVLMSVKTTAGRILQVELVSLGTISPLATSSLAFIAPALETTVEELNSGDSGYHLNFTLTLLYNRTILNGNDVPDYADQMLANWYHQDRSKTADVSVIILPGGPEDVFVNRLAANWNVLLITVGSCKTVQRNRLLSPTWIVTTVYSSPEAARLTSRITGHCNWTSVFAVLDRQASPLFYATFTALNEQYSRDPAYQFTGVTVDLEDRLAVFKVLKLFSTVSRVLLFLGHADPFRRFMVTASQMNMTNPDYVYIASEPFRNAIIGDFTWYRNDSDDAMAFAAFQSVLLMALYKNSTLPGPFEPPHLRIDWKRRSRNEFNYSYSADELFVPHVAGARYTTEMVAQVLNATISLPNFDHLNGAALAKMLSNRTFLVDGKEIIMDEFGLRQMDWTLSLFDNSTFRPFVRQTGKLHQLEEQGTVRWYGGEKLPANEPVCGFRGMRSVCQSYSKFDQLVKYVVGGVGSFLAIALLTAILILRNKTMADVHHSWWLLDHQAVKWSPSAGNWWTSEQWTCDVTSRETLSVRSGMDHRSTTTTYLL